MKLRRADVALMVIVVLMVIFGILAPAYVAGQANEDARRLACLTVQSNRNQLEALNAISEDLGLPRQYPLPPVTPECVALLSS